MSAFSKRFSKKAGQAEDFLRSAVTGGSLFSSMGFYYIGPIDGHDVNSLVSVLKDAKEGDNLLSSLPDDWPFSKLIIALGESTD